MEKVRRTNIASIRGYLEACSNCWKIIDKLLSCRQRHRQSTPACARLTPSPERNQRGDQSSIATSMSLFQFFFNFRPEPVLVHDIRQRALALWSRKKGYFLTIEVPGQVCDLFHKSQSKVKISACYKNKKPKLDGIQLRAMMVFSLLCFLGSCADEGSTAKTKGRS